MNNNRFNSFYFLHIQKTAGRSFVANIVDAIKPILLKNNIQCLDNNINKSSHSQWRKDITNFTYVTSILRDPCEQAVSFYVHSNTIDNFGNKKNSNLTLSVSDFFDWFYKNENVMKNYQSKNFILDTIEKTENFFEYFSNNHLVSKDVVLDKIKMISLLLKPEILKKDNIGIIQNKILSDMGILEYKINQEYCDDPQHKNIISKQIYNSLTLQQKEIIRSISNIDTEIYETEDLFWNI